jgi:hypothetical protein
VSTTLDVMTAAPSPVPPQGPGVVPPFPAPPTEGRRWRIGFGLGIGALVLLLVCGGGLAAMIGFGTVAGRALNEQADVVISAYIEDIKARRYAQAYESLCAETRATTTQAQFTSQVADDEPIGEYDVGQLPITSVDFSVPVTVTYRNGDTATLRAYLGQNQQTGQFQVCRLQE